MPTRPLTHWFLLFALVAMWGSSFLLTKVAVTALPPASVVAGRLVLAAALLAAVIALLGRRLPRAGRPWLFFAAIAVTGNALPFFLISWGQQRIDSGLAGILMAVMPLTTLVLAHFLVAGERMTPRRVGGFLMGFAGIVVLTGPEALAEWRGAGSALVAQVAVLGGAVSYAVTTIIARHKPPGDPAVATAGVSLIAAGLMAPLAAGLDRPWTITIPIEAAAAVGVLGVMSTAVAGIVYFRLIALAGPSFLSLINYLIPVWAVGLGIIALNEEPKATSLFALALVLGGIGFAESRPRKSMTKT